MKRDRSEAEAPSATEKQRRGAEGSIAAGAAAPTVLDSAEFETMCAEMLAHDERRETVIKRSREILKLSKGAIFTLHRGDVEKATQQLAGAERVARELLPTVEAEDLRRGAYASGLEEWVEGRAFLRFLEEGTLVTKAELELPTTEEYLGGVCDLTGEIGRFAVQRASKRDTAAVERCRYLVDAIQGELMKFDFRNGPLRKKYDSVKYAVRRLETILYELSLTRATEVGAGDAPPAVADERGGDE